jgi:hypothetical protein
MTPRRAVIAGGAGAAVLAALGYRAWERGAFTSGEGPAFEAWQDWRGHPGEGAKRPLHAAILASSAHNTQPWLFEPHEDSITVYADLSRNLGAADPFRRELYFSLGCAIENLYLAAFSQGFLAKIETANGRLTSEPRELFAKAAEITLLPVRDVFASTLGEPFDNLRRLYKAIPDRHTNRGRYMSGRPLPESFSLSRVNADPPLPFIIGITGEPGRKEVGAMIVEATERFTGDSEMSAGSGRWFRTGRREIEAHRDGVTTDTAGLSPFMNGVAKLLPDQDVATADKYWLAATRDVQVPTATAFGIYFVHDRLSIAETLDAGMHWQNQHLMATLAGLAAQPLNQPIEMMDRDLLLGRKNEYAEELRRIAGLPQGDPAFIFRLGYAEREAKPSPRRRFEDVIRQKGFA